MESFFSPEAQRPERPLPRHRDILGTKSYEMSGRLPDKLKRDMLNRYLTSYIEVALQPQSHLDSRARSTVARLYPDSRRFHVSSIEFDSQGRNLVSVTYGKPQSALTNCHTDDLGGCIAIHSFHDLMASGSGKVLKPRHYIPTSERFEAVKWSAVSNGEVPDAYDAIRGSMRSEVHLYDIETASRGPTQVLSAGDTRGRSVGRQGFRDVCYHHGSLSRVLACGQAGNVLVWDRRASKRQPCSTMQAPRALGPLHCLELSGDNQVVYAGSESGHIQAWDMRGRRTTTPFSAFKEEGGEKVGALWVQEVHTSVKTISLEKEFQSLPAMQEGCESLPSSALHSLSLNPANRQQMAFLLRNGLSGVYDTVRQKMTHCSYPQWPRQSEDLRQEDPSWQSHLELIRKRKAAWLPTHSVFCVPHDQDISLFNFSASASRASLHNSQSDHPSWNQAADYEHIIHLAEAVVSLAAHTGGNHLVAGTLSGNLALLTIGGGRSEVNISDRFPRGAASV